MQNSVFNEIKLGGYKLKNRFLMSAAAMWKVTKDNILEDSEDYIHYKVAEGGPAMIIGGGVNVHPCGLSTSKSGLFDYEKDAPFLKNFAHRIKSKGTAACFQVTHGGMWAAQHALEKGLAPLAPSFIVAGEIGDYSIEKRKELPATEKQIYEIIEAYGNAALGAKNSGFDAVEVHAAHESLLAQFLSPISNIRKDAWGDSVENRCRLHCEIIKNIRKKVGTDFPLIIKLGVADALGGGLKLKEGIAAAEIIAKAGNISAIEVSQGLSPGLTNFKDTSMKTGITNIEKEGYYRQWAKQIKNAIKSTGTLVIMQGGLRSFELIEEIIENREADLVSMCRPYICEPLLIKRWQRGDCRKARCISCNKCVLRAYAENKRLECVLKEQVA